MRRELAGLEFFEGNHAIYLAEGCGIIKNIETHYQKADIETKQLIIGSIFPAPLIYSENKYRTKQINEVVALMSNSGGAFKATIAISKATRLRRDGFVFPRPQPKAEKFTNEMD